MESTHVPYCFTYKWENQQQSWLRRRFNWLVDVNVHVYIELEPEFRLCSGCSRDFVVWLMSGLRCRPYGCHEQFDFEMKKRRFDSIGLRLSQEFLLRCIAACQAQHAEMRNYAA